MGYSFLYLYDEAQIIARAYDAVYTPDFFGFNRDLGLKYRGRLDSSGRKPGHTNLRWDLYEAMKRVAETGLGLKNQIASMGCSIKWKSQRL